MPVQHSRYSAQQIAQRGDEIYEQVVRSRVETAHQGKIVAIDIESEAYAVADTALAAAHQLNAQCPDAQIWFVRIGHRALHRIGRLSKWERK